MMSRNIYKSLKDPDFRGTYIVPLTSALQYSKLRTYNFTLNILKLESFATLSVGMYYQKNFFLAPAINEVIRNLQSGGLIEYWHFMSLRKEKKGTEVKELEKLSLNHLKVAFEILLIGCSVSSTFFTFEIILDKILFRLHLRTSKLMRMISI